MVQGFRVSMPFTKPPVGSIVAHVGWKDSCDGSLVDSRRLCTTFYGSCGVHVRLACTLTVSNIGCAVLLEDVFEGRSDLMIEGADEVQLFLILLQSV